MVMRKNMKKVAILTLAFGFLSSLGNVGAIIKKEGSVTPPPSSEISMITRMMMGFPVRVPVPGPVHGPVPVHGHAPVPGPVPVHGPDFCLPRPSNSIYNSEPNIEKLAREFAKVLKNYLYKHYKKR